jgi:biopolymer transport protein ExbD
VRFYSRKRRQPPAIIIVALIDILIVLLIFLMVTTTFKQQPALRIVLPESSQAQKTGANETAPMIISVDEHGSIRLGKEAKPVTLERLKAELADELAKSPELKIAIMSDKSAPVGQIVKIMDATREAGIKGVNLITKEAPKS